MATSKNAKIYVFYLAEVKLPSRDLLAQSQQYKHQNNVQNLFKANSITQLTWQRLFKIWPFREKAIYVLKMDMW